MLQMVCVLACMVPLVIYLFYVAAGRQDETTDTAATPPQNTAGGRDSDIAA